MKKYRAIGLMSGTSLDGLDIVLSEFWYDNAWNFKILKAITQDYSAEVLNRLQRSQLLSARDLKKLDNDLGDFFGDAVVNFLSDIDSVDFIASHGHTIFHEPDKNLTLQIGNGANIYAKTGIKTICDFRSVDVALNGQGAPLVPIGDQYLFSQYDACLNLGGFSNISFQKNGERIAFDICPVNIVLNEFAQKLYQKEFDENGDFGKSGKVNLDVLKRLNNLSFYATLPPKSLGKEWLDGEFRFIVEDIEDVDIFASLYEHIAQQIVIVLNENSFGNVLITGGGANNSFLIDLIRAKTNTKIVLPERNIIDYKEALIFSFLGVLRMEMLVNCLSSATGSLKDNIGGAIYG